MDGREAGRETATTGRHLCRRGRVVGVSVVLWYWMSAQKEGGGRVWYRDDREPTFVKLVRGEIDKKT